MPKPLAKWNPARDVWETQTGQTSLFCEHSDVYSETFPTSGTMRDGVVYQLPEWVPPTGDSEFSYSQHAGDLLGTPRASEWKGTGPVGSKSHKHRLDRNYLDAQVEQIRANYLLPTPTTSEATGAGRSDKKTGGENLRTAVTLLPTPNTMDMLPAREGEAMERQLRRGEGQNASRRTTMGNLREDILQIVDPNIFQAPGKLLPTPVSQPSGNTPENHLRKKPGRKVVTDLAILVENGLIETGGKLLPTPKAGDGEMHTPMTSGRPVEKSTHLGTIAMLQAGHLEHRRTGKMLPTPRATDGTNGGPNQRGSKGDVMLPSAVHQNWGQYEPAIRRWEEICGQAPEPTEATGTRPDGTEKHRLNARFAEWMMGLPPGWVTGETSEQHKARLWLRLAHLDARPVGMRGSLRRWQPGLTRNEQLKAIGNGVVPQQAIAALREMLATA